MSLCDESARLLTMLALPSWVPSEGAWARRWRGEDVATKSILDNSQVEMCLEIGKSTFRSHGSTNRLFRDALVDVCMEPELRKCVPSREPDRVD